MAKASLNIPISRSLGAYSTYPAHGIKKMIVIGDRRVTHKQIKTLFQFQSLRLRQSGFNVALWASAFILSIISLKPLAYPSFDGNLTKIAGIIPQRRQAGKFGKRSIFFSANGSILNGFNLNSKNPFDTVVRQGTVLQFCEELINQACRDP